MDASTLDALTALIGGVGGGALRIVPEVIDAWRHRNDPATTLELAKLDLEKTRIELEHGADPDAPLADHVAPVTTPTKPAAIIGPHGIRSTDATGLIVSIVTLWLLALYTVDKALALYVAITQHSSLADVTNLIWTSSDMEIFGGAVTFWFIDRALAMRRAS